MIELATMTPELGRDARIVEWEGKDYILLVEDDGAVSETLTEALQEDGHRVVTFEDGQLALDYLRQKSILPLADRSLGVHERSVQRSLGPPVTEENGQSQGGSADFGIGAVGESGIDFGPTAGHLPSLAPNASPAIRTQHVTSYFDKPPRLRIDKTNQRDKSPVIL